MRASLAAKPMRKAAQALIASTARAALRGAPAGYTAPGARSVGRLAARAAKQIGTPATDDKVKR